eukprot:g16194.t1
MDLALKGKTALVTGSYRGTGQIIAQTLAAEGVNVLVHGLEAGQAEAAVASIGSGTPVTGDITTDQGADAVLEACQDYDIDILVNNYGVADRGSWMKSDTDAWIEAYQKNVLSAQRMIQGLLPPMELRGWGRIINLGTIGSSRPNARMPAYYSAKGALATLTVSLAKEVAAAARRLALAIYEEFTSYRQSYFETTDRARQRFEEGRWLDVQTAGTDRLASYHAQIDALMARAPELREEHTIEGWPLIKAAYTELIDNTYDAELAETFYNSVYRLHTEDGPPVKAHMFLTRSDARLKPPDVPLIRTFTPEDGVVPMVKQVLKSFGFSLPFADIDRDVANILRSLVEERVEIRSAEDITLEMNCR